MNAFYWPLVTCLASVLLSGCVAMSNSMLYGEPTAGPQAEIIIRVDDGNINQTVFRLNGGLDGCNCSAQPPEVIATFHGYFDANYAQSVGRVRNQVIINVPADGRPFRMMSFSGMRVGHSGYLCQPNVEFVPQPGASYIAIFDSVNYPCELYLRERVGAERKEVPVKRYPLCLLSDSLNLNNFGRAQTIVERCEKHPEQYPRASVVGVPSPGVDTGLNSSEATAVAAP